MAEIWLNPETAACINRHVQENGRNIGKRLHLHLTPDGIVIFQMTDSGGINAYPNTKHPP
jgi:hypothetical protein